MTSRLFQPSPLPGRLIPLLAVGPALMLLLALPVEAAEVRHGSARQDALINAARVGDLAATRCLLRTSPELIAARDDNGYSALHWSAVRGHWQVFEQLIEAEAPVDVIGADGGSALHWACHHDRPDMVQLLLDRGADLSLANRWGRAPLHVAARRGCVQVARLLLKAGAAVDATTREGWTPLAVASRSGHPEMVTLLLQAGADEARTDEAGLRPTDHAKERPARIELEPERLRDYVGEYDLGNGHSFVVWIEDGHLNLRDVAPDQLYPTAEDRFACRHEPWTVSFSRDDAGQVVVIEVDFIRQRVRGRRSITAGAYVGASTCASCHASHGSQHVTWMRSGHAMAYWRLATDWARFLASRREEYKDIKAPIEEKRCLTCHTSTRQATDAVTSRSFDQQEGVGCEACHGPGSAYSDPEIMQDRARFLANGGTVPDEQTCRSCHQDDRFDLSVYGPKISHPRPEPEACEPVAPEA